jgi:hypothetical protein
MASAFDDVHHNLRALLAAGVGYFGAGKLQARKKLAYALKRGEIVQYSCGTSEIVPSHSIANV